jgi:hypothetical protein
MGDHWGSEVDRVVEVGIGGKVVVVTGDCVVANEGRTREERLSREVEGTSPG